MKLRLPLLLLSAVMTAVSIPSAHALTTDVGKITFVGDSITQGGNGDYPSYRYSLWKNMVDNNVTHENVGSITGAYNKGNVSIPSYGGAIFSNVHEGHFGWRTQWATDTDSAGQRLGNNLGTGTVATWVGNETHYTGSAGLTEYTGTTYVPDTVTIMMGINDLASGRSKEAIAADIKKMADEYRKANPDVRIVVLSVLSTGSGNVTYGKASPFNEYLSSQVADWNGVEYKDVTLGLNMQTGYHTYDHVHPNAQGELIIAGNVARALGIGQRTAGQARKAAVDFNSGTSSKLDVTKSSGWGGNFTLQGNAAVSAGSQAGTSYLQFAQTQLNSVSCIQNSWTANSGNAGFSVELSMQLSSFGGGVINVSLGDGITGSGLLTIGNGAISWGNSNTFLYAGDMTQGINDFRICYILENSANGLAEGYYVWFNGQLIGEALSGGTVGDKSVKVGNLNGQLAQGLITGLTLDSAATYAPSIDGRTNNTVLVAEDIAPEQIMPWPAYTPGYDKQSGSGTFKASATAKAAGTEGTISTQTMGGAMDHFYGNSGAYTGDVYSHISGGTVNTYMAANEGGILTGNAYLKVGGSFAGGKTQQKIEKGVASVFGAFNGNVSGDVYLEFNTGAKFATFTPNGPSVSAAYGANIGGKFGVAILNGEFYYTISGGSAQTGNVGGGSEISIYGGNYGMLVQDQHTIMGGSWGGGTVNGGSAINIYGGTIKCDVLGGGRGNAVVNGGSAITIEGTAVTLHDGSNWRNIYGAGLGTSRVNDGTVITLRNVAVSGQEYGFDKFAGTINGNGRDTGSTTEGTRELVLDNYLVDFKGTLQNFDRITARNGTITSLSGLGGAGLIDVQDTSSVSLAGVEGADISKTGGGTLEIGSGNSGLTGILNASGGKVKITSAEGLGGLSGLTLANSDLVLSLDGMQSLALNGSLITGSGNLTLDGGGESRITLNAGIGLSGDWNLTAGTLYLGRGINDFTNLQNIVFNGGKLYLSTVQFGLLKGEGKILESDLDVNVFLTDPGALLWPEYTTGYDNQTGSATFNASASAKSEGITGQISTQTGAGAMENFYGNSGAFTGNVFAHLGGGTVKTYIAANQGGVLTGNAYLKIDGSFAGGKTQQTITNAVASVFGAYSGNVTGDVYLEFNTTANFSTYTENGTSVSASYGANIGGKFSVVILDGNFYNTISGGSSQKNTVEGGSEISIYGGSFGLRVQDQHTIMGGSWGEGTVNGGSAVNIYGGTIKCDILGGGRGSAVVNGGSAVTITGSSAILHDGASWRGIYGAGLGTSAVNDGTVVTLKDVAASDLEYGFDKFAGNISGNGRDEGSVTNGTKQFVLDNYAVAFKGTLSDFDIITAKNRTNTILSGTGGAETLNVEDTSIVRVSGITGTQGLAKTGTGRLELAGDNSGLSGVLSASGGSLGIFGLQSVGSISGLTLNDTDLHISLTGTEIWDLNGSGFSGTGDLRLDGSERSSVVIDGEIALEGDWTLVAGTLKLGSDIVDFTKLGNIIFDGGVISMTSSQFDLLKSSGKVTGHDQYSNIVLTDGAGSSWYPVLDGYARQNGSGTFNAAAAAKTEGITGIISTRTISGGMNDFYGNSGVYTGDVYAELSGGTVSRYIAANQGGALTGDASLKMDGTFKGAGTYVGTAESIAGVFGTFAGNVSGKVYLEFNASANYSTYTGDGAGPSVAASFDGDIGNGFEAVFRNGDYYNTISGGAARNGTVGGGVKLSFHGGSFGLRTEKVSVIMGGSWGGGVVNGGSEINLLGGTFKGDILGGGGGAAIVNGGSAINIIGTEAVLHDGMSWKGIYGAGLGTSAVNGGTVITLKNIAASSATRGFDKFAGTISGSGRDEGSTVSGTRELVFDNYQVDFKGTLSNFDKVTVKNGTVTTLADLGGAGSLSIEDSSILTLAGLSGSSDIVKTGAGSLVLSGANNGFNGTIRNSGADLLIEGFDALGAVRELNMQNAAADLRMGGSESRRLDGTRLTGTGDLTLSGAGTLTLTNTWVMNGEWNLDAGRLVLDERFLLGGAALNGINFNGGLLEMTGELFRSFVKSGLLSMEDYTNGDSIILTGGIFWDVNNAEDLAKYATADGYEFKPGDMDGQVIVNTSVTGDHDIVIAGKTTISDTASSGVPSSGNDYTGSTTINRQGTLIIQAMDGLGNTSEVVNNGKLVLDIDAAKVPEGVLFEIANLAGDQKTAQMDIGSSINSRVSLVNDKDTGYAGTIVGSGTLVIKNADGSSGQTLTAQGDISITHLIVNDGGSLVAEGGVTARSLTIGDASSDNSSVVGSFEAKGNLNISGKITLEKGGLFILNHDKEFSAVSLVSNGGTLQLNDVNLALKGGTGTAPLVLNSNMAGSGNIEIRGGTVRMAAGLDIARGFGLYMNGKDSSLDLNGNNLVLESLSGAGTIIMGDTAAEAGGKILVGAGSGREQVFDGDLKGKGVIENNGAGTLKLTGRSGELVSIAQTGAGGKIILDSGMAGGSVYDHIQVGGDSPFVLNRSLAEGSGDKVVDIRTNTSVGSLTVANDGYLVLGDVNTRTSCTLSIQGKAVFESGAKMNIAVSEKLVADGTAFVTAREFLFEPGGEGVYYINITGLGDDWAKQDSLTINVLAGSDITGLDLSDLHATYDGFAGLRFNIESVLASTANGDVLQYNMTYRTVNPLLGFAETENQHAAVSNLWQVIKGKPGVANDSPLGRMFEQYELAVLGSAGAPMASEIRQSLSTYAGSSVTTLRMVQAADFRQQLEWIRNRVVQTNMDPAFLVGTEEYANGWIQANSSYSRLDSEGDKAGYTYTTWGGTAGAMAAVNENLAFGAAFTVNNGKVRSDYANGSNDANYVNLFAYINSGNWRHTAIVTCGWNEAEMDRTILIPGGDSYTTRGTTNGYGFGASYEAAYNIVLNDRKTAIFQPIVSGSVYSTSLDEYTETGAGNASMNVSKMSGSYAHVGVGGRLMGTIGPEVLGVAAYGEVRAMVVHDLGDVGGDAMMRPSGSPCSFRVLGVRQERTAAQVGGSISFEAGQGRYIFADVSAEFRNHQNSLNGNVGYKVTF